MIESTESTKPERRVSTPLVLALASGMVCIGIGAMVLSGGPEAPETALPPINSATLDDSTAHRAAESFVDAWRKRDHGVAAALTIEEAAETVQRRHIEDEAMSAHERELKTQVWDAMAAERLRIEVQSEEEVPRGTGEGSDVALETIARGTFVGSPYEREVSLVLRETTEGWRVVRFEFGEILTQLPSKLRLEDD